MPFLRLTAAALVACCVVPTVVSADDQVKDNAIMVRVVLHKVHVAATDKDGKAWNLTNGKPDIVVRIQNLSDPSVAKFESERVTATLQADFNGRETFLVKPGQELQINVVDKGLVLEKTIGHSRFRVTDELVKTGKVELKFDQVEKLILEFRRP